MAITKKTPPRDLTTGFGTNSTSTGGRFYRKDGRPNLVRRGVPFFDRLSWYHTMLSMPHWKFWLVLCSVYLAINLLFADIYYHIGAEHLSGVLSGTPLENFAESFFFSAQTFTTVGYGRISPTGILASSVAAFEAFLGVLTFALASGLFYGRFSRPKAYLYFSDVALLAPFKEGKGLMFRTVPYKNNQLMDAEVKITLGMRVIEKGETRNVFYPLELEFSRITTLVMNWTIVHPITESSPLFGMTLQQMKDAGVELLVHLKAFDDVFANTVVARTSYTAHEFVDNARFKPMYHASPSGTTTILEVDVLNEFEPVAIK